MDPDAKEMIKSGWNLGILETFNAGNQGSASTACKFSGHCRPLGTWILNDTN